MNTRSDSIQSLRKLPRAGARPVDAFRHPSLFASRVFDASVQESALPKKVADHLEEVRCGRAKLDHSLADAIAEGLQAWASQHGATHFMHSFQPLTHLGAEKHDSFLNWGPEGLVIERLRGRELLFGEPDASSLPSGGLRVTHEARGYTAWDGISFPFLWESADGLTLCIPALFYSWKGAALDHKIPLLRSDQKISAAVVRLLSFCGMNVSTAYSTLGAEQEYFLIDRGLFSLRTDLLLCGRTVFGAKPAKGQELEDHYFGALKHRVVNYMHDVEEAALRIGIPLKSRHNEVAPSQHEAAPLFERAVFASDHNLLLMELMRDRAAKHDLACLFHEKPFRGFNGSGKHNNWSIATDTGENLLDPKGNSFVFLTLLTAVLRAVHEHAALLRSTVATAGNDHRLGGAEAPPSILSVYLGEALEKLVLEIVHEKTSTPLSVRKIDIGLSHLPEHETDPTDRNRTSFFAFTSNKFEFRAVGASQVCAFPMAVLSAIVADSLELICDEIADAIGDRRNLSYDALMEKTVPVLRKHLTFALPILFGGNAYSPDWHREAASRGLPNVPRSFHAFEALMEKKSIRALEGVLSEEEIKCRFDILNEQYAKTLNIELNVMIELFQTQIVPAVQKDLQRRFSVLESASRLKVPLEDKAVEKICTLLKEAGEIVEGMVRLQSQSLEMGWEVKGKVFCELISPKMEEIRQKIDELETLVDDELWLIPKYREILF